MGLKEQVYSVLIVSSSERFNTATAELLPSSRYEPVVIAGSASEARRSLAERRYDFVIINSPLPDETGSRLAIDICHSQTTVTLILSRAEVNDEVQAKVAGYGVFTLPKPTSHAIMLQALSWMATAREQLRRMEQKTTSIEDKMEEIRIVNRAKCLLISERKMSESEAHHFIEKTAMDNCIPKKTAAMSIILEHTNPSEV